MRKIKAVATATAAISALAMATPVTADVPVGSCPSGGPWTLIRPMHQPQEADLNGDGLVCFVVLDPGILAVDNAVRLR